MKKESPINNSTSSALLQLTIAMTLASGLIVTWPVWTTTRDFPLVPVFQFLPELPNSLMIVFWSIQLFLLIWVAFSPHSKIAICIWLTIFLSLCLFDVNRLQPYTFMFGAMLVAMVVKPSWKRVIALMQIVVIGVYLWSGIHKFSSDWLTKGFPATFGQAMGVAPIDFPEEWKWLGISIPIVEIGLTIGLFIPRMRNFSAIGFCLMHAMILLLISPIFLNWNVAVIPWNMGLPVIVLILFYNNTDLNVKSFFREVWALKAVYIVVFLSLPALNLVDRWPHYLSFSLYSGKAQQAMILMSPKKMQQLPETFDPYIVRDLEHGVIFLNVSLWAQGEIVCLPFPEAFVYEEIYQQFCEEHGEAGLKLVLF